MHNILCMHNLLCFFLHLMKILFMLKRKVIELPEDVAPLMKQIGLKVVEYRKKIHPNYRKFAELNNINLMTLWRVQNGEDVKLSSFLLILKKIGVSPQDFFSDIR
jgi:hypothetical protein